MEIIINRNLNTADVDSFLKLKGLNITSVENMRLQFKSRGILYILFFSMTNPYNAISRGTVKFLGDSVLFKLDLKLFMIITVLLILVFDLTLFINKDKLTSEMLMIVLLWSFAMLPYSYLSTKQRLRKGIKDFFGE